MTDDPTCPLMTFVLLAYNQKRYIREAVEAALAQDYANLEIIISDDCSSDQTFEVIENLAIAYDGPHKIILNRNATNSGLSAHVAKLHGLARGEIIFHAAGDDISMPHRVSRVVREYYSSAPKPSLIETNAIIIDENGDEGGLYHLPRFGGIYRQKDPWISPCAAGGSTYAITKRLIEAFTPIPSDMMAEDALLAMRANYMSGVLYIPEPLIKYRITSEGLWNETIEPNLTSKQLIAHEVKWSKHRIQLANQARKDIAHLSSEGEISADDSLAYERSITQADIEVKNWIRLLSGNFIQSTASLILGAAHLRHIGLDRWIKSYGLRWAGPIRDWVRKK
jgi:glycosyltransferase involved in cell wall biosynthesis